MRHNPRTQRDRLECPSRPRSARSHVVGCLEFLPRDPTRKSAVLVPPLNDQPRKGESGVHAALRRLAERHPTAYRSYRTLRWLAIDSLIVIVAGWLAICLRFEKFAPVDIYTALLPWLLLPAVVTPAANLLTGVTQISWRRPSPANIVHKAVSATIALGITIVLFYGLLEPLGWPQTSAVPRSYWPMQAVIALALGIVARSRSTWLPTRRLPARSTIQTADSPRQARTILYGAGAAGAQVAREARDNLGAGLRPVAFLDDDQDLWGQRVAGLPVLGGSASMKAAAARVEATQLLITMPTAGGSVVRRIYDAAVAAGLRVKTMPALGELIAGTTDPARIRPVNVEDLLRRPASEPDQERIRALVSGKRVLVTGAAGSIGSEILRQVLDAGPALLVAFDQAESALFDIEHEILARIGQSDAPAPVFAVELGSVSDGARLRDLFARYPVDIVVHAAAYKHVPLLETHPSEAVVTNVGGTLELLEHARASGAHRFVLVSTDKAVNPANVMGATKRLAELAVVDAGRRFAWDAVVVRFGNVLGSAGSVIPLFERQLATGAPITITHPEATRFFMTIPEASRLVLSAAALGGPGMTYVLKMGDPVRIVDLARDLIRLSGRQEGEVEIQYIGLRPGERLHETLFNGSETDEPTQDPRILKASSSDVSAEAMESLHDLVARALRRQISACHVIELAHELGGDRTGA